MDGGHYFKHFIELDQMGYVKLISGICTSVLNDFAPTQIRACRTAPLTP